MGKLLKLVLIIVLCSCNSVDKREPIKKTSTFNLEKDYMFLKDRMSKYDTVIILTDLSICTSQRYDKIILTKPNEYLSIKTEIDYDLNSGIIKIESDSTQYYPTYLLSKFWKDNVNYNKATSPHQRPRMLVIHKLDTLKFYTDGLVDANKFISAYAKTMDSIFPGLYIYK